MKEGKILETIYFAGGCLWGVQHFIKSLFGVEIGRASCRERVF